MKLTVTSVVVNSLDVSEAVLGSLVAAEVALSSFTSVDTVRGLTASDTSTNLTTSEEPI